MDIVTRLLKVLVLLMLFAGPVGGSEPVGQSAERRIELAAHRALARVRANSKTALSAFATDGCSGGLSSAWTIVADQFPAFREAHGENPPWEKCCVIHDVAYHSAGPRSDPETSFINRAIADRKLRECVIETGNTRRSEIAAFYKVDSNKVYEAYRGIANSMYLAVRLGGAPCTALPWRWGFGYPNCYVKPVDLFE